MADAGTAGFESRQDAGHESSPLGKPIDFEIRGIGRRLPGSEAPEGWIKKFERPREGKLWIGYFHLWTVDANGRRSRLKKEKTLGPASMPKHEAQAKLAEYIEEYTGRIKRQGDSIMTFAELWRAFAAVRSGRWSKKTREDLRYLFAKHVFPILGETPPRGITLTMLQLLVNKLAEDGYGESVVGRVRTYIKACFEYATDEEIVEKNPARKLVMPNIRRKRCERFLSVGEIRTLLAQAPPREHLELRILAVCGLRPAEALVLRLEDFERTQLRIDEALKERQRGDDRVGTTKTTGSDSYVPVPPDFAREITAWIAAHPARDNPRAFLFPNSVGTAFSVGNYLKRHLKPLAEAAGVPNVTLQAFRRTSSTHIQTRATVKDMQRHLLRHPVILRVFRQARCRVEPVRFHSGHCGARISLTVLESSADASLSGNLPQNSPIGRALLAVSQCGCFVLSPAPRLPTTAARATEPAAAGCFAAYSERCRSAFRADVDRRSEVMSIRIPR